MADFSYTYEDLDKDLKIKTKVSATVHPYVPASRNHPSEGGYLEDVKFEVEELSIDINGQSFDISITDDKKEFLNKHMNDLYEKNEWIQEDVFLSYENSERSW